MLSYGGRLHLPDIYLCLSLNTGGKGYHSSIHLHENESKPGQAGRQISSIYPCIQSSQLPSFSLALIFPSLLAIPFMNYMVTYIIPQVLGLINFPLFYHLACLSCVADNQNTLCNTYLALFLVNILLMCA
jgi:hypothetical protein